MTVNLPDLSGPGTVPDTTSHWQNHAPSADLPASVAVLEAVEASTGDDALQLPPLHDTIDPDALDALLRSNDESFQIEFDYAGQLVVITDDGQISVTEHDA